MAEVPNTQRSYAAIGRVCAQWSDIEWFCQQVAETTAPLLAVDYERQEVGFVLTVALAHMDIRNKIATAKVYVEQAGLPASIRKPTLALLNKIDNEYRLERNRYVHDEWIISVERSARSTMRPKIVKPQARKTRLLMADTKVFSVSDMEAFADTLSETISELIALTKAIEAHFQTVAPALRSFRQAEPETAN